MRWIAGRIPVINVRVLAARLICLLAWLAAFLTGRAADPASPSPAGTSLANLAAAARLSLLSITTATAEELKFIRDHGSDLMSDAEYSKHFENCIAHIRKSER